MGVSRTKISAYSPSEAAAVRARAARRFCGSWWGGLGLLLMCLTVYLPGLVAIPPVDRDESRFAHAARQMLETGDYVVPRRAGDGGMGGVRLNKPPLIYWLQCASAATFGDAPGRYANANIWVFRLPSVLCAIGAVLLTWRMGLSMFDARAAFLGAAMLAICPMVVWDAHQARADQLLLLTVTATQWALLRVWRDDAGPGVGVHRKSWARAMIFWACIGAGVMAKGPITPLIAAMTIAMLSITTRDWRWIGRLRPFAGLALVIVMVAPWVVLVAQRVGWESYVRIVYDETIGRSASPRENHWFPPGFHAVLFPVLFWPGSLLTGLGLARAFRRGFGGRAGLWSRLRNAAGDPASRFMLCWIVPAWIFFELISTKLPHYTMPLYPAIALLSARAVFAAEAGRLADVSKRMSRMGFSIWVIIGIAATLGLSGLVLSAGRLDAAESWLVTLRGLGFPAAVIVAGLIAAARALQPGRFVRAQVWGMAIVMVWGATFLQVILPRAQNVWVTPRVAELLGADATLGAVGYVEDSLIFTTRGRTIRLSREAFERGEFGGAEMVLYPAEMVLSARAAAMLGPPRGRVRGFNYSNGKSVDLIMSPTGLPK